MSKLIRISMAEARHRTETVLVNAGTAQPAARSTAEALVLAEADGHSGHGLVRLASYAAQVRAGKVYGHASPKLEETHPGSAVVDAGYGFAYPALDLAIGWLAQAAPIQGAAIIGICRSGHCGALGLVVERLARRNLVALIVANTPAAMAPWGGKKPLLGTNPIACAFPYQNDPVVIDLSLAKVARGHVLAARKRREPIPEGLALDADGADHQRRGCAQGHNGSDG